VVMDKSGGGNICAASNALRAEVNFGRGERI